MSEEKPLEEVFSHKSWGEDGMVHVVISLSHPRTLTKNDKNAIYDAGEGIIKALRKETKLVDQKYIDIKKKWLRDAKLAFYENGIKPILVSELPNGYCGDDCCPHMPWLSIATTFGMLKVGWRKRVIHLEWTGSFIKESAHALFPNEDVTKSDQMIHAWGYEKLGEYLKVLKEAWEKSTCHEPQET